MNAWYAIKTKPKQENRAAALLGQVPMPVFLPTLRRKAETGETKTPLFPGYFFIKVDFACIQTRQLVRFTRGVHSILGDGEGPIPLDDALIETLMAQTRDGSLIEQDLLLKEGDEVRVKAGILKDLIGIIEKNMSETGRVRILFNWLSGSMQAVLRYRLLEKIA